MSAAAGSSAPGGRGGGVRTSLGGVAESELAPYFRAPGAKVSGELPEPGDRGVDALVGGGQRHPDVVLAGGAVELTRGGEDAHAGQRAHRGPAVQAGPGGPQVQA